MTGEEFVVDQYVVGSLQKKKCKLRYASYYIGFEGKK